MRRWPAATGAPEGESGLTCCCDFWGGDLSEAMTNPQARKEKIKDERSVTKKEKQNQRPAMKLQCASSAASEGLDTGGNTECLGRRDAKAQQRAVSGRRSLMSCDGADGWCRTLSAEYQKREERKKRNGGKRKREKRCWRARVSAQNGLERHFRCPG